MNIVKLEQTSDVKKVLEDCLSRADNLSGVVVLGLFKDSSQLLETSTMNAMEKSFLAQFFNAWMNKWFDLNVE